MDKIAAEIFAPLLAGMSGQPMSEAIKRYREVEDMAAARFCTIRVPRVEVTLHPRGVDPRDLHWTRTGTLTDDQTQRMYELLIDDPAVTAKAEAIAEKLARGEVV